jgi:carbon storage regulator CsrA
MLVLSRKRGERIVIGPNIELTVVDICGSKVRLAVDAADPKNIQRTLLWRHCFKCGCRCVVDRMKTIVSNA